MYRGYNGDNMQRKLAIFALFAILLPHASFAYTLTTGTVKQIEPNEIIEQRTENSQTFDNKNGTLTTRQFLTPQFIKTGTTEWKQATIDAKQIIQTKPLLELIPTAEAFTSTTTEDGDTYTVNTNGSNNSASANMYIGFDSVNAYRAWIRWTPNSILQNLNISKITFNAYNVYAPGNTSGYSIELATTTSFDPTTITGANQPSTIGSVLASQPLDTTTNSWKVFDMGTKLNGSLASTLYFRLKANTEAGNNINEYHPNEYGSNVPYFEITYTPTSTTTTATSTSSVEVNEFATAGMQILFLLTGMFGLGIGFKLTQFKL